MKLLYLCRELPSPPDTGEKIRNYNLVKELSKYCNVHLLCLCRQKPTPASTSSLATFTSLHTHCLPRRVSRKCRDAAFTLFDSLPYTVRANSAKQFSSAISQTLKLVRPDIVVSSGFYQAANLPRFLDCPLVIDAHNRESLILERLQQLASTPLSRGIYRQQAARMKDFEQQLSSKADLLTCVSELEAEYFANFTKNVFVARNGVLTLQRAHTTRKPAVLFTGLLSYPPNRDAVMQLLTHIWPIVHRAAPDLRLKIVSKCPNTKIKSKAPAGVEFLQTVTDIQPLLSECCAAIVPLRAAAGTRFKIVEAFSSYLPVVSTSIGAEGLPVEDEVHLLIRNSPQALAEGLLSLVSDPRLAQKLSENAAQLIESEFLWENIGEKLYRAIKALIK